MRIPIESSTSYRGRNVRPNWLALFVFVGIALGVGGVGACFSPGVSAASAAWYAALTKPAWTPPLGWLGPVWGVLYLLIGTSGWLIWHERYHRGRSMALLAYAVQLLLNSLWAPLFFGDESTGAGLFITVASWLSIVWNMREAARVRSMAAWLLAPYLAWVSFAVALNLNLWRHNP